MLRRLLAMLAFVVLALTLTARAADEGKPGKKDRPNEGLKGDLEVDGKKYGLVLDIGGYYKNVVTLAPNLHITNHEMDLSLKLLERVLYRVSRE